MEGGAPPRPTVYLTWIKLLFTKQYTERHQPAIDLSHRACGQVCVFVCVCVLVCQTVCPCSFAFLCVCVTAEDQNPTEHSGTRISLARRGAAELTGRRSAAASSLNHYPRETANTKKNTIYCSELDVVLGGSSEMNPLLVTCKM